MKIKNNGGSSIPIIIKDQFPISVVSDIKVKRGDAEGAKIDDKTGIITWSINLNTMQSKSIVFDYAVDYQNGQVLFIE
jgi:hypothetical protein